jgi:hypothetical protein
MNIKRWFIGKLKNALRNYDESEFSITSENLFVNDDNRIKSNGLDFTLYNAHGGWVLEYRSYDRKTDTQNNQIYIIKDGDDYGNQISKILTIELLRR